MRKGRKMETPRNRGIENCPKCGSAFIQYDEATNECYCLEKSCNYRWTQELDFENISNPYLRTSIKHALA